MISYQCASCRRTAWEDDDGNGPECECGSVVFLRMSQQEADVAYATARPAATPRGKYVMEDVWIHHTVGPGIIINDSDLEMRGLVQIDDVPIALRGRNAHITYERVVHHVSTDGREDDRKYEEATPESD